MKLKTAAKTAAVGLVAAALILCEAPTFAKKPKYEITLKSPSKSEVVNITNENVMFWWDEYEKYSSAENFELEELTTPSPVKLKWKGKKGYTYKVSLSVSPKFRDKAVYKTKKNSVKLYNLLRSTRYYWKVTGKEGKKTIISKTRSFRTKDIARVIGASCVYNARDIGGYPTADGGRTLQGRVYRSAELDDIDGEGIKTLKKKLKIKTDLDLRQEGEGTAGTRSPVFDNYIHNKGTSYLKIFENDDSRVRFVNALRVFADSRNYPILVHCVYGRDRTGTLVFVLNGLLGVSRKNLYRDYELSFLTCKGSTKARKYIEQFDALYKTMRSYMDKNESLSDNIRCYLLDSGMTEEEIESIKSNLLKSK